MKYFLAILTVLVVFRLGLFYFSAPLLSDKESVDFSAVLLEEPKLSGNNQTFSLRFGDFWKSQEVTVSTSSDEDYAYGQTIHVIGTIDRKLLKNNQVVFSIQNPQIEAKNGQFLPIFGVIRAKIINFCENNFSQPYSGLLVGIIFGIKSLLTHQITVSFRITGVSHIVAASGMNVTLVAGFLFGLFGFFLPRKWAIGGSLGGIFLYVLLSGFDASIVRAAFMGIVAFSAAFFGRQYSGLYVLFLVCCLMLLWDPLLLTDVGFQLSILATAGILLLKPSLFGSFFSDDIGTTIAAQLATLPVLLSVFGQYSLLSIVVNALVLWTIPLIMTVGGVGILVGLVVPLLGRLIVACIIPLLWYVVGVVNFFSSHSLSVDVSNFPMVFIVGYYLLLGGLIAIQRERKRK